MPLFLETLTPEETQEPLVFEPPRQQFARQTVLEREAGKSFLTLEAPTSTIPVRDDKQAAKMDDPDFGSFQSFLVGVGFNPINRFIWKKMISRRENETPEQRDVRAEKVFNKLEEAAAKRPVAKITGQIGQEMIDFLVAGGLVTGLGKKLLAKLPSLTVQRLVRGGAIGATEQGAEAAARQVFTEEDFNTFQIVKEASVEGALTAIGDAGLGKIVDAWRAGRVARISRKQAKIIQDKVEDVVKKNAKSGVLDADTPAIDEAKLKDEFFPKEVKGFKVVKKNNTLTSPDAPKTVKPVDPKRYTRTMKRLSGDDAVLDKSQFKKTATTELSASIEKLAINEKPMNLKEILKLSKQGAYSPAELIPDQESRKLIGQMFVSEQSLISFIQDRPLLSLKNAPEEVVKAAGDEILNAFNIVQSQATHSGRLLRALQVKIGQGEAAQTKELLNEAIKTAKQLDLINADFSSRLGRLDLKDFEAVQKFHREFVKPKLSQALQKFLYVNLLSSPKTQIVNGASGIIQTTMPVFERAVEVPLDWMRAQFRRTGRKKFFGEIPAYIKGIPAGYREALNNFVNVATGKKVYSLPELRRFGASFVEPAEFTAAELKSGELLFAKRSKEFIRTVGPLDIKLMEATDIFLRTLITGGQKSAFTYRAARIAGKTRAEASLRASRIRKLSSKGRKFASEEQANIDEAAMLDAEEWLFRQNLFAEGQGNVLKAIDIVSEKILAIRDNVIIPIPGLKRALKGKKLPLVGELEIDGIKPFAFVFPFVQTPVNIFKKSVEFSPLGFTTIIGSGTKTRQAARAIIGSVVYGAGAWMAFNDRLSWKLSENPKLRSLQFAADMQPYSATFPNPDNPSENISISYRQLGPLGLSLALTASLKHHWMKAGGTDEASERLTRALTGSLQGAMIFFSDMTYMKGTADIMAGLEGRRGGLDAIITNPMRQFIPYVGFLGWADRMSDKVYRDPEGVDEFMMQSIPFLSELIPPHADEATDIATRQFPFWNAFSPFSISKEDAFFKEKLLNEKLKLQLKFIKEKDDKEFGRLRLLNITPAQSDIGGFLKDRFKNIDFNILPERGGDIVPEVEAPVKRRSKTILELANTTTGRTAQQIKEGGP